MLAEAGMRQSPAYRRALDEWRECLATLAPAPALPLARDPSALTQARFRKLSATLDPETALRFERRCACEGVSVVSVLLSAYAWILAGWSETPRFSLNIPTLNRLPLHPDVNRMAGPFSSFTIVDVDRSKAADFLSFARQVQQELIWGVERQMVSGVTLAREWFERKGFGTFLPVVFTSLGFGVDGVAASDPGDAPFHEVFSVGQTPQVWIDNRVRFASGLIGAEWDVVEDLFPEALVEEMFKAYCGLLEQLASGAEAWRAVPREWTPPRQRELIETVNATDQEIPRQRFETGFLEAAARQPRALALVSGGERFSYEELRAISAHLAARLACRGAHGRVAIVMERGWEQVAAALGILQAGAAYVPLDASQPAARLAQLMREAGVETAFTQPHLAAALTWPEGVTPLVVDRAASLSAPDQSQGAPADLAYLIYTSGSTGAPKAVMMTHDAACNTILDLNQRFNLGACGPCVGRLLAELRFVSVRPVRYVSQRAQHWFSSPRSKDAILVPGHNSSSGKASPCGTRCRRCWSC